MNNKNDIKKAISLAVLAVLIQNNQAIGWGGFLNPVRLVKKIANSAVNVTKKTGYGIFHNVGEKIILRSRRVQDKNNKTSFVPGHYKNMCWLNVFTVLFNETVSDDVMNDIENKLKVYRDNWVYVENPDTGLDYSEDWELARTSTNSIMALENLIKDCKKMRNKENGMIALRKETREALGYYGDNGGNPKEAWKIIKPAMEHCGYTFSWKPARNGNVGALLDELLNKPDCKTIVIPVYGKEPVGGHNHVFCVVASKCEKTGKWTFREINDMSGNSWYTLRFNGYINPFNTKEEALARIEELNRTAGQQTELITLEKLAEKKPIINETISVRNAREEKERLERKLNDLKLKLYKLEEEKDPLGGFSTDDDEFGN